MKTIQILLVSVALVILSSCGSQKKISKPETQTEDFPKVTSPTPDVPTFSSPCEKEALQANYGVSASAQAFTVNAAKDKAYTICLGNLASKIEPEVVDAAKNFLTTTDFQGKTIEQREKFIRGIETFSIKKLKSPSIICSNYTPNGDGTYTYYMAVKFDYQEIKEGIKRLDVLTTDFEMEKFFEYMEREKEKRISNENN